MPTPPSPTIPNTTTLSAIQTKVRRLTRSISENQLSTADLNNYINTFTIYDFPEQLRTFNLRTTFTFWCNAFQDVYPTDITIPSTDVLYNFQNKYISVHPPVYVAGFKAFYTQSPEQFWGIYPFTNSISTIGQFGDGATTTFAGTVTTNQAILLPGQTQQIVLDKNNVLFSSVDANNNGLAMVDYPINNTFGNLAVPGFASPTIVGSTDNTGAFTGNYSGGQIGQFFTIGTTTFTIVNPVGALTVSAGGTGTGTYDTGTGALTFTAAVAITTIYYSVGITSTVNPNNFINYITGQFVVTFPTAPGSGEQINSQTVYLTPSRPQAVMYYANSFTLRPIPDQPYAINLEVYQRPTALLSSGQSPELEEYWQLISFEVAKKILEDRMDMESVQLIMPALLEQRNLVNRRTIVQYTNERTATIYTENTSGTSGYWGNGFGGGGSF